MAHTVFCHSRESGGETGVSNSGWRRGVLDQGGANRLVRVRVGIGGSVGNLEGLHGEGVGGSMVGISWQGSYK